VGRRARLLLVVDPELVPMALLWRRGTGGPVVADVHEDYGALLHDRSWARGIRWPLASALVGAATRATARADLTVVADEHLAPRRARARLVVRNQPRWDELPEPSPPGEVPRALYVGDLRRSRGLHTMVEAVLPVPDWHLDLVGPVSDADREWVRGRIEEEGATQRVRLHGRLPPQEAWALAQDAWVGLALLADTPAFREAMPTKIREYLGSGLPVLVSDLPRMAALVRETGAGVVTPSAAAAAETLRTWREDPAKWESRRAAALRWRAEHLRRCSPFDDLADAVAGLLKEPG
jgi:glycosyltransferase involved in cell wall biosynthesis